MQFWLVLISTLVFSLAFGIFFATTAYSVFFGAPFVPTDSRHVAEMIAAVNLKPGEIFADLGCGDGRLVIAAAQAGAKAEGWEIIPYLCLIAKFRIWRAGVGDRAKIHWGSYWWEHFSRIDVVSLFLIDIQMARMQKKLQVELRPGSRVVSYVFKFPEWQPISIERGVYLYLR